MNDSHDSKPLCSLRVALAFRAHAHISLRVYVDGDRLDFPVERLANGEHSGSEVHLDLTIKVYQTEINNLRDNVLKVVATTTVYQACRLHEA